jgi:putative endonuclease
VPAFAKASAGSGQSETQGKAAYLLQILGNISHYTTLGVVMDDKLYYVYLLRSLKFTTQTYVGFTEDVPSRIKEHNRGGSIHAGKYRPWQLVCHHVFPDKKKAKAFEQYLKSGSGRAFAKRHLW